MSIISNLQSFSSLSSSGLMPGLVTRFKTAMDTVLQGGRNITIHLPPQKSACPSVTCRYNSTYKKFMENTGGICKSCKGQGFLLEQRQTIYMANIRATDVPFDNSNNQNQATPAGRMKQELVRTKTVIQSYDHIKQSIGVTIDGEEYSLWTDPRKTGFGGTLLYVITFWKEANK